MPRNMSFAITTDQIRRKEKTVTRRNGWRFLKAGDIANAVEKAMGLRKGEKVKQLCRIRIISTRLERLCWITEQDVVKEGFADKDRDWFIQMYCQHNGGDALQIVNRIEFDYM